MHYYQSKDLDFCVAVISLNANLHEIKKTCKSVDFLSKNYPCLAVIPEDKDLFGKIEENTNIVKGGKCITSMFDAAIKNSIAEWVYLVFAGTIIRKGIDVKLSRYVKTENDVIFPVVDRIWNFVDGSMNGVLINKKFHKLVGDFGSGNPLKLTKLNWAAEALAKGVNFKAIVGAFSI